MYVYLGTSCEMLFSTPRRRTRQIKKMHVKMDRRYQKAQTK